MSASHPFFYPSIVLLISLSLHLLIIATYARVAVGPVPGNDRLYSDPSKYSPRLKLNAANYIRSKLSFHGEVVDRSNSFGDDDLLNEDHFQPHIARQIEASPEPMETTTPSATSSGTPSASMSAIPSVAIPSIAAPHHCECKELRINNPRSEVAWKYVGEPHKLNHMTVIIQVLSFSKTIKTSYYVRRPRRMLQMYARVDFAPANRTTTDLRGKDYRFWQNRRRVNFYDSYDPAWFCAPRRYPITITAHVRIGAPADSFGNIPKNGQTRQFVDYNFNLQASLMCST